MFNRLISLFKQLMDPNSSLSARTFVGLFSIALLLLIALVHVIVSVVLLVKGKPLLEKTVVPMPLIDIFQQIVLGVFILTTVTQTSKIFTKGKVASAVAENDTNNPAADVARGIVEKKETE